MKRKRENAYVNLVVNVALPAVILTQLSGPERLGPLPALVLALIFPIGYGIYDIVVRKKVNVFSLLGIVGTFMTGIVGVLELDYRLIAFKEASVPFVLFLAIILTQHTKYPVLRLMFDEFMDIDRIRILFEEAGMRAVFERKLTQTAYLIGLTFLFSALFNFILAKMLIVSPTGTQEFNEQLGVLQVWSYPVIALPSMAMMVIALYRLLSAIRKHTGLSFENILRQQ